MSFQIKVLLVLLCYSLPLRAYAQQTNLTQKLIEDIDSFNSASPTEKVFLQTDRPYYSVGDTTWMKCWVLNAALEYSKQSGLLYIELIDDAGKVALTQSMPVKLGISFGQLVLNPKLIDEGTYTLRAYTNWMQNQGEKSFFAKKIFISKIEDNPWLITGDARLTQQQGVNILQTVLVLNNVNKTPLQLRKLQLEVKNGKKTIHKVISETDLAGKINLNFNLPEKADHKHLVITGRDMVAGSSEQKFLFPVLLNEPENTDVQFLPEGGRLVNGLPAHVGFKAISEDGSGIDVTGEIIDNKNLVITKLKSLHKGMGSFDITPKTGVTYSAKIILPGGRSKVYPLPENLMEGINLHIGNFTGKDSLYVSVNASPQILNSFNRYSLIAQSRGKVCYAAGIFFNGHAISGAIPKNRFQTGITRFTLFDPSGRPIAERLVFIDHQDELRLTLETDQLTYQPKDSVALRIKVSNDKTMPVIGSFSLSVTDDSQIKADSSSAPDIRSYMLLCSDLTGKVEEPGYYFNDKNEDRHQALDDLLITQGWVGYDWKNILDLNYKLLYHPEPEIQVSGKISRVGNEQLNGLPVVLMSTRKPMLVRDTMSDADGRFVFKDLPPVDTASFIVQVNDRKNKMFEANVSVDEFIPAKITRIDLSPIKPWYVNTDSTLLNYINQHLAYRKIIENNPYPPGMNHLKEVVIKELKTVKGSHFFAGAGALPDMVLDEVEMKKANKMTIQELLTQKVKGFSTIPYPCKGPESLEFTVGCNPIAFYIDGFAVDEFYTPRPGFTDHYDYIKSFIGVLTAEDVRGIETKDLAHYSIIEITTWSGNGAFMKRTQGRYLYRPMPVTWPKQFYKPKFTKVNEEFINLRPTIYWEPNIISDTAGNATVWFKAKGKPGSYTGILQGSDLNGNIGVGKIVIKVNN